MLCQPKKERGLISSHKDIRSSLSLVRIGEKDNPIWVASRTVIYSSFDTWNAIREKYDKVDWFPVFWYKLLQWGFQGDVKCVFCRGMIEDRAFIFCLWCWQENLLLLAGKKLSHWV